MNNPQKFFLAAIGLLLFSSIACKKSNNCTAGSGGAVTIVAYPQHHGRSIYSVKPGYPDSVFVKFSPTSNFVTTTNPADYDVVVAGDSGKDFVNVPNLKCGDYYIFMTGWDDSINQRVKGGIPYPENATSGTDSVAIPVTE